MDASGEDRSPQREPIGPSSWYFLGVGAIIAVAIIALAFLPYQIAYLGPILGLVALIVLDRLTPGHPLQKPSNGAAVSYVILLGIALLGSMFLTWTLGRDDAVAWLPWVLAILLFALSAVGIWIPRGRAETA